MIHSSYMRQSVIAWGGYDDSKPRVRLLLDELRRQGVLATEIHIPVWSSIQDKSVAGWRKLLRVAFLWAVGLPRALWRIATIPAGQTILLPYPGTPEIFIVSPLARLRRHKIVLDAFLPIHDTIVHDRALVKPGSIRAWFIKKFEELGLKCADIILVDTDQHGVFFEREFGIPRDRILTVLVGAEPQFNSCGGKRSVDDLIGPRDERPLVLFYGQLIPLHGLSTILEAAYLMREESIRWVVVGKGQQEPEIRRFLERHKGDIFTWVPWVDYERLPDLIVRADICLGVFGKSDKAGRVIPNKLFQTLAMGKTVITRASPAVDDLAKSYPRSLHTVPEADAGALAEAVRQAVANLYESEPLPDEIIAKLGPSDGIANLIEKLSRAEQM